MNDFNNSGLNGAFSDWLKKSINWVIGFAADNASASTGGIFRGYISKMAAKLQTYFDGDSNDLFRPSQSLEDPTPQEQIILNGFISKISVFVKNVLNSVDQGFAGSQTNISIINAALSKMCIAKEYFFYNEKEGLSQNAINQRHKLIQELLNPIEESITERLGTITGIPVKVLANQNDFNGLFVNSVAGQSYLCKQYQTATNQSGSFVAPTKTIATKNDELIDLSFSSQPFNSEPIKLNPNDDLLNPSDSKIDIDKTFKYVSYGLLAITAFGVVKSIFKKKQQ